MTIFTKDGNVYKLNGPNPLVEKQVSWNIKSLIFYNFSWNSIVEKNQEKEIKEELNFLKEPIKEELNLGHIEYKVLCHCLPVKIEMKIDELYGETRKRFKYGEKFIFPCVIIEASDLYFEIWTNDPKNQVLEKSIIYPFVYEVYNKTTKKYDKVPYDDCRWWKVTSREPKENGWLIKAIPSDTQPDFS